MKMSSLRNPAINNESKSDMVLTHFFILYNVVKYCIMNERWCIAAIYKQLLEMIKEIEIKMSKLDSEGKLTYDDLDKMSNAMKSLITKYNQ